MLNPFKKRAEPCWLPPPDMAGKPKPPCFVCGKPSIAWVTTEDGTQRFCPNCVGLIADTTLGNGKTVALINRSNHTITITKGEK